MNVITEFLRDSESFPVPDAWRRLTERDCPVRRCPSDLEGLLSRLQASCGIEALVECGLLQHGPEGLGINHALQHGASWLSAHFDPELGDFCGLSTASGLLTSTGTSQAGSIEIATNRELSLEADPTLFISYDATDMAVLGWLGHVARPVEHIRARESSDLEEVCALLGWPETNDIAACLDLDVDVLVAIADLRGMDIFGHNEAGNSLSLTDECHDPNLRIVLVGWSPAELKRDMPDGLSTTVEYLRSIQDCLSRDLSNVCVWRPTATTLEKLRFAVELGGRSAVRAILEGSLAAECWSLTGFQPNPIGPPHFLEALNALDVPSVKGDPASWQRAVNNFTQAYSREIIEPFFYANSRLDPESQSLRATTAMLQKLLGAEYCALQKSPAGGDMNTLQKLNKSSILATTDRLLRTINAQRRSSW